jgi:hypothetical protein
MARRKTREQRRLIWLNRIEWIGFLGCVVGAGVAIWLFIMLAS